MARIQAWLKPYSWEFVTAQNALLCQARGAFHGPTSEGHRVTRELWVQNHQIPMGLEEAVALCRQCHRLAPFCFYNGNTFAGIIRDVIQSLGLPPAKAYIVRSLVGHIVAGVSTGEEEQAFHDFCRSLDSDSPGPHPSG